MSHLALPALPPVAAQTLAPIRSSTATTGVFEASTFDLGNLAALEGLKRQQLYELCNLHNVDTARSNQETIQRLQKAHKDMSRTSTMAPARNPVMNAAAPSHPSTQIQNSQFLYQYPYPANPYYSYPYPYYAAQMGALATSVANKHASNPS